MRYAASMEREQEMAGSVERREHPRLRVALVARVEGVGKSRLAVTQDISRSGALLLSEGVFDVGDSVLLTVIAERTDHEVHVHARVRRMFHRGERPWRCGLALQFDQPLPAETAMLVGPPPC